jgi:serine/threonine protein kinase
VVSDQLFQLPGRSDGDSADAELKGVLCGMPDYMAPEQVDPQRLGVPDVRTDVYALGGILFEILYLDSRSFHCTRRQVSVTLAR